MRTGTEMTIDCERKFWLFEHFFGLPFGLGTRIESLPADLNISIRDIGT